MFISSDTEYSVPSTVLVARGACSWSLLSGDGDEHMNNLSQVVTSALKDKVRG